MRPGRAYPGRAVPGGRLCRCKPGRFRDRLFQAGLCRGGFLGIIERLWAGVIKIEHIGYFQPVGVNLQTVLAKHIHFLKKCSRVATMPLPSTRWLRDNHTGREQM